MVLLVVAIGAAIVASSKRSPTSVSVESPSPSPSPSPGLTYASSLDPQTARQVRKAYRQLLDDGYISKVQGDADHLDVTVGRSFYSMSYDEKMGTARAIAMACSLNAYGRIVFKDYYTEKELGEYLYDQLKMR
jgi:hypothetical protein